MLTRNIDFKNFKINKNTQKVKIKLKKLLQENNEVIKSLRNIEKARIVSANKLAAIDVISTDVTVFSIASAEQFAGGK